LLEEQATTPLQRAHARFWTGALEWLAGDERGHETFAAGRASYADLGLKVLHGGTGIPAGLLALMHDARAEAVDVLEEAAAELEEAGETGYRSTVLALLGAALAAQGRLDEAERARRESAEMMEPDDVVNVPLHRLVDALVAADRGDGEAAARAAREAGAGAERWQFPIFDAYVVITVADVLQRLGGATDARRFAERALEAAEHKGIAPIADRARALLAELAPA
jgi:ATP/maltotriose-dependent transcriptional regulator MalT